MSDDEYERRDGTGDRLKDLPRRERPRERLLNNGPKALSTPELLAIVLGSGSREETVLELSRRLLKKFGSLRGLSGSGVRELQELRGIGPAKATQLRASLTLADRLAREQIDDSVDLSSPEAVFQYFHVSLRDRKKEVFLLLNLDGKNRLMEKKKISEGTLTSSLVHPREVFRPAIRGAAASVLFVHNHPSGDPTPSDEDIDITDRLVEVGELVGIPVIDHVIIGDSEYRSFQELGLIS